MKVPNDKVFVAALVTAPILVKALTPWVSELGQILRLLLTYLSG